MFMLFVGVLVLFIWIARLHGRVVELESQNARQASALSALQARLHAPVPPVSQASAPAPPPTSTGAPAAGRAPERPPAIPVTPPPAPGVMAQPAPRATPPPSTPQLSPPPAQPRAAAAQPPAGQQGLPPRPPLPTARPPLPQPPPPARPAPAFDLEALVGVKLFSWVAGIALALGAIFFLRHSIQSGWLQPPVRMAMGVAAGVALLAGCEMKAARRYPVTANAMDAAGIVILFSTFFAAHALWGLIGALPAFALLVLVTAVAVLLAIRRDSAFIALLGLVGGFATPAMLSTGQDNPLSLFGYLLLLNAGLAWVAYQKRWVELPVLSLVFTTLYQWGWVMNTLTPAKMPLAASIFLAFPLLAWGLLALTRRPGEEGSDRFRMIAAVNAALPLLFALYLAAVPVYGDRFQLLFGFLFLLAAGLFVIARARGPQELHALGAASTLLVFFAWWNSSYAGARVDAWRSVLAFVTLFVLFYLWADGFARRRASPFNGLAARAVLAAPLLLFMFPAMAATEPGFAAAALPFGVLFVLLLAIAAHSIVAEDGPAWAIAASLAVACEAVWTLRYLSPERLLPALAVYVALGLLYLAVPLLAVRLRRVLRPSGLEGFVLFAHAFLVLVAVQPSLSIPPWPLFVALAAIDVGIAVAALRADSTELHVTALGASQLLVIVWVVGTANGGSPWPVTGMSAAVAISAFALACAGLARLAGLHAERFDTASATGLVLGQFVLLFAANVAGAPAVHVLVAFELLLLVAVLVLASGSGRLRLAVVAVLPTALAALTWHPAAGGLAPWAQSLLLAAPIYLAFLFYPLVIGARVGGMYSPHLAAVLASAVFFVVARRSLIAGGFEDIIGALPLVQAGLMGIVLAALLRLERPGERMPGRLAMVAGTVLAFVTVALPLQLEKEWLTIGWALEAAALAWLYTRIPHRGLFWTALGLLAVVFVRLALNPEVLVYQERGAMRLWNWYLYIYLMAAGSMLVAGRWLARSDDSIAPGLPRGSQVAPAAATVLLFILLNIEIADFFATGSRIVFNFSAGLAQDLTYTLGWAAFAVVLLTVGIALRSQPARLAAITLLTVTVLKGFLHDVARLGGLYRVMSFVGLAICLALVAVVLQRFVLGGRTGERSA